MTDSPTSRVLFLFGAIAIVAIAAASLVPTQWEIRTGLHWLVEHFIVYFAATAVICIAFPRPFLVAASLMVLAGALEALQGLTADRTPDLLTAVSGAGGVVTAAIFVKIVIHLWKRAPFRSYDAVQHDRMISLGGGSHTGNDSESGIGLAPARPPSSHRLHPH